MAVAGYFYYIQPKVTQVIDIFKYVLNATQSKQDHSRRRDLSQLTESLTLKLSIC
jgi:hypothetical protein